MALTFPKRSFTGAGVAGTLDAPGITSIYTVGDTFKSSTTLTGWDDVTGGVWAGSVVVAFGVGTAGEEKILCNFAQSTSTFTIVTRGYDGTSSAATSTWGTGSLFTISFTATEAAELNAVTQSMKTILTSAGTTTTPQPITVGSSAGSIGTGTKPSAIDHDHKITVSTLNSWLSSSAAGALPALVTLPAAQVTAGALPSGVTIPLAQITNPPAAGQGDSSANYSVTFTGTADAISSPVNPDGNFKQYVWRVSLSQQSSASGAAYLDVKAIIRYRIVGASTWTSGAATTIGAVQATNDFRCLSGGGVVTLGSADNYEFQIGFQTAITGYTVTLNQIRLVVEGLN